MYLIYFSLASSFLQKTKETREAFLNGHILFSSLALFYEMEKETKVNAA